METPTNDAPKCPLSPALIALLQLSFDLHDTSTKTLALALTIAPSTVDTQFQRILEKLGVRSREWAVLEALEHGWISRGGNPSIRST